MLIITCTCIAAYILYTHMMTQRRKVMKAAKAQNQKAQ